jgi:DNA-binding winged helix-turn-helix (wHTH) protein
MAKTYEFGGFRLEPEHERLWRGEEIKPLEPKMFMVLRMLVEDAPALVPKEKLQALWSSSITSPAKSLNQSIYMIRQALSDEKPYRFIRSRAKRGYEFVAPVKQIDPDVAPLTTVVPIAASDMPRFLSLSTKRTNPQWADIAYYAVEAAHWRLSCAITSSSPYFRFGFKLTGENGRIFGDAAIQSDDPNLIVHVGRNYWDRPGITKRDLFFSGYANGRRLDVDKKVKRVPKVATAKIELIVGRGYETQLLVDGVQCFRHVIPPEICSRVAIMAWGDQDDCSVDIADLSLKAVKG